MTFQFVLKEKPCSQLCTSMGGRGRLYEGHARCRHAKQKLGKWINAPGHST